MLPGESGLKEQGCGRPRSPSRGPRIWACQSAPARPGLAASCRCVSPSGERTQVSRGSQCQSQGPGWDERAGVTTPLASLWVLEDSGLSRQRCASSTAGRELSGSGNLELWARCWDAGQCGGSGLGDSGGSGLGDPFRKGLGGLWRAFQELRIQRERRERVICWWRGSSCLPLPQFSSHCGQVI